jgi:hypothetical protein
MPRWPLQRRLCQAQVNPSLSPSFHYHSPSPPLTTTTFHSPLRRQRCHCSPQHPVDQCTPSLYMHSCANSCSCVWNWREAEDAGAGRCQDGGRGSQVHHPSSRRGHCDDSGHTQTTARAHADDNLKGMAHLMSPNQPPPYHIRNIARPSIDRTAHVPEVRQMGGDVTNKHDTPTRKSASLSPSEYETLLRADLTVSCRLHYLSLSLLQSRETLKVTRLYDVTSTNSAM